MQDVKANVAANISELRILKGMTQTELAEKLSYSDKAVSKWERGESIPDITVLCRIAEIFGVTLDYLAEKEHKETVIQEEKELSRIEKFSRRPNYNPTLNHYLIMGISIFSVLLLATVIFVVLNVMLDNPRADWLSFIYAVPACFIIWLVFNSVWFNPRLNFLIVSLLIWSVLAVAYFTFLSLGYNILLIFALGIPAQIIVFMWSRISFNPNKKPRHR